MQRRTVIKVAAVAALAGQASFANAARGREGMKTPKGFYWGTAISAHQSEANNVNFDRVPRDGVTAAVLGRGSDWIRLPRRAS